MTKVTVQQELLWMIISGYMYKHEKKETLYIYLKRKWVRRNWFWRQFTVCELHKRFCISTCELWTAFEVLVVRQKRHECIILFSFKWLFLDQLNSIWIPYRRLVGCVGGGGGGGQWLQITDVCVNDTVIFLSFFLPIHLNLRGGHQMGFRYNKWWKGLME